MYSDSNSDRCKSLARRYIHTQLNRNGHTEIADMLPRVKNPSDYIHDVLKDTADNLGVELGEQFDEMLAELSLEEGNIQHSYNEIVSQIFNDDINWGRIASFIAFSAHIAVHCAKQERLCHKVPDIVTWTDKMMVDKLQSWIVDQGGLEEFIHRYDSEHCQMSLSSTVMGLGMGFAVLLGGLVALNRLIL